MTLVHALMLKGLEYVAMLREDRYTDPKTLKKALDDEPIPNHFF